MHYQPEMAEDIDIEDHNIFENPELKKIFPDIVKVKQELDEDSPPFASETLGLLQTKRNGAHETKDGYQLPSATAICFPNTSKDIDENIYKNVKDASSTRVVSSNDLLGDSKENLVINCKIECELTPKKEILTCNVCFKESEEEMCKQCVLESTKGATCSTSDNFAVHVLDDNIKASEVILYTSVDKSDLKQHRTKYSRDVSHKGVKSVFCDICGYECPSKSRLIQHIRRHTGERPHKCDLCSYRCSWSNNLRIHIISRHTNERNYFCDICEYKCVRNSTLKEHLRKHTGEYPYKCDLCSYMCSRNGLLNRHIKAKHTNEKYYSCDMCDYKTITKIQLILHLRKHTFEKPYKCNLCGYRSSNNNLLKNHVLAKHTNEKKYSCNMCDYKSVTKRQFNLHRRKHTAEKPYKCDLCSYRCSFGSILKRHIQAKHVNENNYSYDMCDYKSRVVSSNDLLGDSKQDLVINCKLECELTPKKEILTCNVCSKESEEEMCKQCVLECTKGATCSTSDNFAIHPLDDTIKLSEVTFNTSVDKSDLEQNGQKHTSDMSHKVVKSKPKNVFCDLCGYRCACNSLLTQHLRKHTGEKPYKCDLCDYRSSKNSSLKTHILAKHTNEKKYSCSMCEYKTVIKCDLNKHLQKHTGEKPYKCDLCSYKCSSSKDLKVHIKAKHTNEKNYSCDICEYKSVRKRQLNEHLRKHTGEYPYKCEMCSYKCSRINHLRNHVRAKHTNEKNYSCNICEFRSVTKGHLNLHLRKHTGEKPYKCDLCDYKCTQSSNLRQHIRNTHTKEKNYSCNLCEYVCATEGHLNLHLQKHTGGKQF